MIATCRHCQRRGELEARGLCRPCYERHRRAGTLDQYPMVRRPRIQIVGEQRRLLAKDLAERYSQGQSVRTIAAAVGGSYCFVHTVLTKESGVQLRGYGGARNSKRRRPEAVGSATQPTPSHEGRQP